MARFCGNQSDLGVAECWYADSALEDLPGLPVTQINDARLYRGLDVLLWQKDRLCRHLLERYQSWFGVEFEFLLYDVTSTSFEGKAERNPKARRGYSRDQRSDCKPVNIGLVCAPKGLPIGYEVFAGRTTDVTTVEDMVEMMEQKYGQAKRIWLMDRDRVSEDNLNFLRERDARYIVGLPKRQMRRHEAQLLKESDWTEVQPGVEVKFVEHPDGGGSEQYVVCRSADRRQQEAAMLDQKRQRTEDRGKGRASELGRAGPAHCAYLPRTNGTEKDPAQLWRWYIHLTQAEECFKISKSDLNLRPVIHQREDLASDLRLRVVARPDRMVAELLHRWGLDLLSAPKVAQNVAPKNTPRRTWNP